VIPVPGFDRALDAVPFENVLSGSSTTPVSSAISEFATLKVEAGSLASADRFVSLAMMR